MKLLFDQNISFRILKKLSPSFQNSIHVNQISITDKSDRAIWNYAKQYGFTIVTFDADFFDISNLNGHPPKIIWLRIGNTTTNAIAGLLNSKEKAINVFLNSSDYVEQSCIELE